MQLKIKNIKKEDKNTFSLILEKPEGFQFYPGQYLDIDKPFTISSSPTEDFLMITTRFGISEFKKALERMKPGEILESSHPAGTFILDESESAVFLAGGVGITPFRSMVKYAVDNNLTTPIILIYSNSDADFIFKKELDLWQKQSAGWRTNLTIHYTNTSQDGRLTQEKLRSIVNFPLSIVNSIFYLAGPPGLVDDFEKILLNMGIDSTSIRTDRFDGY